MRFEVPQFIDVEDKIFGPFTWRQFLYLGGGLGMAVVLFFTTHFLVFIFIGIPLAVLSGALAFYSVNNRPFSFFLEAIFNYMSSSRLYLWRRKENVVHKQDSESVREKNTNQIVQQKQNKDISSLARKLELQALQKTEQ